MSTNTQFSMAVHILAVLAKSGDEFVNSERIAASVNTNPVVIRRLLGQLRRANFVISQTGANGGARLSRLPGEILLSEVYRAVNCGQVFALHTREPNKDCPVGKNIEAVLCCLQKAIDRGIDEKLGQYTLADVFQMVEQGVG
ncbi:MAG: Rrf2 family transcriptional regulator [Pyrinomonadaceae bacterium]|jgi:Rrf2 family protein